VTPEKIPPIRVALTGVAGQMGQEVVRALCAAPDMQLVAAVSPRHAGRDAGDLAGVEPLGIRVDAALSDALAASQPDVLVDFTRPDVARGIAEQALAAGVRPVIGTSGLQAEDLAALRELTAATGLATLVAPNFALGAILMMRFAREAARFFEHVEIVELHHDRKRDAPSGTAVQTVSELLSARPQFLPPAVSGEELWPGARGAEQHGVRVHSVRMPGLLAHQEVLFGAAGQLLTVRHDAFARTCYMPGVLLGIREVMQRQGLLLGLEAVL
jgi:4-hydroxy-tetrahydrodipicolinate reductase